MSDFNFLEDSAPALITAIIAAFRADPNVQAAFGHPVRFYQGDAPVPAYPYAVLERHECAIADRVSKRGIEHTLHLAIFTRHGGVHMAKRFLGVLRAAVDDMTLDLSGQKISLILPTYSDVLLTKSPNILRGVLRLRVVTEEV